MKSIRFALSYISVIVVAIALSGCAGSRCPREDYGETIREVNPIVREDGTRDFWRLTYKKGKRSYKDDEHYWVHIIEGPGGSCKTCAYGYGNCFYSGPPDNPPSSLFWEDLFRGIGEGVIKQVGGQWGR